MKISISLIFVSVLAAQQPQSALPQNSRKVNLPSPVAAGVAAVASVTPQTITICFASDCRSFIPSSDKLSALEKDRRADYKAVVDDTQGSPTYGATSYQPKDPALADHAAKLLDQLMGNLLAVYPGTNAAAAAKSQADAQKAFNDALKQSLSPSQIQNAPAIPVAH